MKRFIGFSVVGVFGLLLACNSDPLLEKQSLQLTSVVENLKVDSAQVLGTDDYGFLEFWAFDDGVSHDFVVAWSGYEEYDRNHFITVSFDVDGRTGSQVIRGGYGELREPVGSSYFARWSTHCNMNHSQCSKSGSLRKSENGEIKEGAFNNCNKEYFGYSLSNPYGGDTFELTWNYPMWGSMDDYMYINHAEMYEVGNPTKIKDVPLNLQYAPNKLSFTLLSSELPHNKSCEIRFFSNECDHSYEHYCFLSFFYRYELQISLGLSVKNDHESQ